MVSDRQKITLALKYVGDFIFACSLYGVKTVTVQNKNLDKEHCTILVDIDTAIWNLIQNRFWERIHVFERKSCKDDN